MNRTLVTLVLLACPLGCAREPVPTDATGRPLSLPEARQGFHTKLTRHDPPGEPAPLPPPEVFRKVSYAAPAGPLGAYLSPDPGDGQKHPAIIWITGGDCNSIGEVWLPTDSSNDQTAAQYRQAGIVMMFPALRGGNDNPGAKEGFLGEVDDVLAATDFLARQEYVDPKRIYLGGHSTGGTLVLLVAECTDRFRAVFSFGPVDDVGGYSGEFLPFNTWDRKEVRLRSPGLWLHSVRCPTFVFEGGDQGNIAPLRSMARSSTNPLLHFHLIPGTNHFSVLAPANQVIASKIVLDKGSKTSIAFPDEELRNP
jgi:pimeloyl-ACP methyl ester carboxylesterase